MSEFTLRPLTAADEQALMDFHERCSDQTHYLRFFGAKPHLSESEAHWFCAVDHRHRGAIVATDPAEPDQIIGVGRWEGRDGDTEAEGAWVVADAYQGRGIGRALVEAVIKAARDHGVKTLVGEVLSHNAPMRSLLSRAAVPCTWTFESGTVAFRMDVADMADLAA